MPLVYIPDHLSPAVPSYGLGPTAPSCPSFRSPQASFHPADAIAARKQALLADFARSLDEQYPSTAPSPPVFGQYSQQHLRQQFLQQQQQQQSYLAELERQRAEIALLEAVEEERTRQAVLRRQAAIASYEREQARQRAERQRQYEAEQEQQARLEALRQLSIRQQRQAIYEQQVAEKQRRHRQQQLAQQQQRQVRQQQPSLEDLLTLLAHAGRHQAKEQPSVPARAPAREPTTQPTGDDLPAAFEAFLGKLFGQHGEPSSSTTAKQPSSETPVDERSVKSQPPASYHYIPHPSVARSITHPASSSTPTPAPTPAPERPSTPPARATPAIAVSRSSSPARSSAASPPVTPHSKLSALFARLRSAASEANSLGELQHRLTTLLVEADAIEAGGDAAIRSRRKELVCEVEKVLGALERKEAARKEADSVTSDIKQVEEPAAPSAVSSAAPIAVEESVSTPSAGSDEVQPEDHTPSATATAPVFIPIGSPAPSTSHVLPPADHDDDARSDASSIASPIVVTSKLAQDNENDDDEARSVTSSRSSSSSRRGRKAYVEDAPEEDGFQVV